MELNVLLSERSAKRDILLRYNRFEYAKRDSALQHTCMEVLCYNGLNVGSTEGRLFSQASLYVEKRKSQLQLKLKYFRNKIDLSQCLVVFFYRCLVSRSMKSEISIIRANLDK